LDLRTAPDRVANWLNQERQLGHGVELPKQYQLSFRLSVGKAFDVLFYVDTVTQACDDSTPQSEIAFK
jgi:hypothetical protein